MKTKKIRKIILIVVAAVVGLILAVVIAAAIIWRHEIGSIASIKKVVDAKGDNNSGPVYMMDVKGDYYLISSLKKAEFQMTRNLLILLLITSLKEFCRFPSRRLQ